MSDNNNRQSRKSTGMRTAIHNMEESSNGTRDEHRNNQPHSYKNSRSCSSERNQQNDIARRPVSGVSNNQQAVNGRRPLTREQRLARQRRKRKQQIKAIAMLVIALLIIAGIVIGIVAIVNGAKGDSKETTTVTEESTDDVTEEPETDANGETVAEAETPAEAETTTVNLIQSDGSSIVKPENWNGKTVYLTFDDGPSSVTTANLDVLDQYGVKATFFCLGYASAEAYQDIVNRGHALAAHSYSHDYDTIYANLDAFANDVQQIKQVLENATGVEVFLYRFPGGSNNQVHDCESMTELANYIESIGMKYVDWNADSTDAEYTTADVDVLVSHSLADIEYWGDETDQDTIVLLMHDSEYKTTGTDCLATIIPYLLEKGYAFDKISRDTPDIHFALPD